MFEWLKRFCEIKIKSGSPINPFTPTTQEDPRVHEAIKRTRKQFKQQEASMNARALKAHASDCFDNWTCEKDKCFVIEPDKIVAQALASEAEVARVSDNFKKNKAILKNMSKTRVRRKS
jgi:hypothetical protein